LSLVFETRTGSEFGQSEQLRNPCWAVGNSKIGKALAAFSEHLLKPSKPSISYKIIILENVKDYSEAKGHLLTSV
jgi:type IV secretory pathway VirB9-like protein